MSGTRRWQQSTPAGPRSVAGLRSNGPGQAAGCAGQGTRPADERATGTQAYSAAAQDDHDPDSRRRRGLSSRFRALASHGRPSALGESVRAGSLCAGARLRGHGAASRGRSGRALRSSREQAVPWAGHGPPWQMVEGVISRYGGDDYQDRGFTLIGRVPPPS
jgi:hypothetical protein